MNSNYKSNLPRVKYVLEENEKAALKGVGVFVRNEARRILGEVTEKRTGLLRKNIGYSIRKKTKSVEVGIKRKAFYGRFVEIGHRNIPKGLYYDERTGKVRRPKKRGAISVEFGGRMVAPHPFLLPAAETNLIKIRQIITEQMQNVTKDKAPSAPVMEKVIT